MVCRRLICTVLALAVITSSAFAQGKVKGAKKDIADLSYIEAIEVLQKEIQKSDKVQDKIDLADCYRKVNDTENAEYWYSQVITTPEVQPIHKLYYGMMLQINGKCDQAQEYYNQFATEMPDDTRGQYLSRACQYQEELMTKNAGIFEINHMPFNSNLDDYAPAILGDKVIFASDRDKGTAVKRIHMWTGNAFAELYGVDFKRAGDNPGAFRYGRPDKYSKTINSKYHEAAVAFAGEGSTIFFTRNNYLNGKEGKSDEDYIKLKVYFGTGTDGNYSNLKELPFNSDEYSVAHPTVTLDGNKIYFASDMPGGFGGMDLYVSEKDGETWGPPVNLGPGLNTEGNEIFPFIDKNDRLYFASDGHMGLGGLDQFYSTEKGQNEWNLPVNLGFPVNTTHDDFGMVMDADGVSGYFTSDRDGGAGRDDIYGYKKMAAAIEVYVFDAETQAPIEGADVKFALAGSTLVTGSNGVAQLDMKLNECSDFTAMVEGYDKKSIEGCTKDLEAGSVVRIEIPMSKISNFRLEGIVFDMTNGLPATGAKVTLANDCAMGASLPVVTDETGRYSFELSKDCCYTVKAEKDGFIASSAPNNCTKGQPDGTTLQANLNLTPYRASEPTTGTIDPVTGKPTTDLANGTKPNADGTKPRTDMTDGTKPNADGTKPGTDMAGGTKPNADGTKPGTDMAGGTKPNNGSTDPNNDSGGTPGSGKPTKPAPKYNAKTGLYEGPDGKPVSVDLGNGMVIRDGVMYEDGKPTKPADVVYEPSTSADGSFLLNIYYDFDQATIRQIESEDELNKLLTMMTDNPEFLVEIASYTDARGSDTYNYRLSQRRAEAVIKWLTGKGVNRDRLIAHGYGETNLTNKCKNHVKCTEKDHQMNRRTEFRILGCKGGNNISISKPKNNPKVDPCENCPF
jgi:outer membrane protein OmpA-like peptidoglycan-associated protein